MIQKQMTNSILVEANDNLFDDNVIDKWLIEKKLFTEATENIPIGTYIERQTKPKQSVREKGSLI